MTNKKELHKKIKDAYFKKITRPSPMDRFAANHIRSRFVWAFIK